MADPTNRSDDDRTRAIWNDTEIASSDDILEVEGNACFPEEAVQREYLRLSQHTTICGWKGIAHYCDLVVGDAINENATWYYSEPRDAAAEVRGPLVFWNGVKVTARGDRNTPATAAPGLRPQAGWRWRMK